MPLNKTSLKTSVKQAFLDALGGSPTSEQNTKIDTLAGAIADAMDAFVKTATVTVSAGIPVSTAGTAAAQTGATTAPGTGTLS